MPSNEEITTWQQSNPDVALFLQDSASVGLGAHEATWCDPEVTEEYRTHYINGPASDSPYEPARCYNALNIPNGTWTVEENGVTFRFKIWTVRTGTLAGQRIVKVQETPRTSFRGFAFITRSGELRVWRRSYRLENAPATNAMRNALAFVRMCSVLYVSGFVLRNGTLRIERTCPICNSSIVSDSANTPLCNDHARLRDSYIGTEEPPTQPRRTRTPRLLLCENGTGMIR